MDYGEKEAFDAVERAVTALHARVAAAFDEHGHQIVREAQDGLRVLRRQMRPIKEVISLQRMRGAGMQRLLDAPRVLIETENGFWRPDGTGYCYGWNAAIFTGMKAYQMTKGNGPDKRTRYHVLKD